MALAHEGFNDAAALRRGKHGSKDVLRTVRQASMMPRHYAAENRRWRSFTGLCNSSFNDAAALRRGKHFSTYPKAPVRIASMMPRHYAAENAMTVALMPHIPMLQ